MSFSQFLLILRARRWILIATVLLTVSVTLVVSLLLPKTYKATASLLLNYKGMDPVTGLTMPGQLLPGYMATQIDIISSKNVALRVVDRLRLAESPSVVAQFQEATGGKGTVRDWLAELLIAKLDVNPSRESSVVEVGFKGSDPEFVAAVANAFADEYQLVNTQLKVEPMKRASTYFNDQIKLLRDNVETAQSRLSKYQQEHGIVSVDNRLDVESNRLNDLSAQLVMAQGQVAEANSRQRMAGNDSPDVANSPLIQSMKINLGTAESKFAEVASRLSPNHPQYQSAKSEVDKLRSALNEQLKVTSNSVGANATILMQREATIRAALEAQRAKVLEMNRARDEMNVLNKDVESAQRAFDAASQRLSQTNIEGQSNQSEIAVLNPAVAPIKPAGPKIMLNTILAGIMGTMLGLGFSILAEMLNRRVRSESDIADALQIPVLGAINWKTAPNRRAGFMNSLTMRRLGAN
jgi:chain length determinant protein EpsF